MEQNKINKNKIKKTEPNNNDIKINNSFNKSKDPLINKVISNLLKTKEELKLQISKYNSNEKLLKSKSYINILNKNPQNLLKDKTYINEKIKFFEKNKEICLSKINFINYQIDNLNYNKDKLSGELKQKINKNLIKLNKSMSNKNIFEKKLKNLQNENYRRTLIMQKDLKICNERKIKQLNDLEKEKEKIKYELLKEIRNKEREDIVKRTRENMENVVNLRKYLNERPKNGKYLYKKILQNYLDKEYNLVQKENYKRKKIMKHIDGQEFIDMEKKYLEHKEQQENEIKEKMENIKQEWSERQKILPAYINSFTKKVNEEISKNKKEKELKLQKIKDLKHNQIIYSKNVPFPTQLIKEKINNSLTDRKTEISKKNEIFNRVLVNSINYSNIIRNQNYNTKKKKLNNNKQKEINKSSDNINKDKKEDKVYNYLTERRKLKKENYNKSYNYIKKYLKINGINDNTLNIANDKLERLDEQKKQKLLLLKYGGGIGNNIKIGENLFDIMIDSINTKIYLIENMIEDNNKENKNINESIKMNSSKEIDKDNNKGENQNRIDISNKNNYEEKQNKNRIDISNEDNNKDNQNLNKFDIPNENNNILNQEKLLNKENEKKEEDEEFEEVEEEIEVEE